MGISEQVATWILDRWSLLDDTGKNLEHGTEISKLVVGGNQLSGDAVCSEPDGEMVADISVFPDGNRQVFQNYYPDGPTGFLTEISNAVFHFRSQRAIRIYNISLCFKHRTNLDQYSIWSEYFDNISEDNDVIFIISAGNISERK